MKNVFYVLVVLVSLCMFTSCSPELVSDESNLDSTISSMDKGDAQAPGTRDRSVRSF